MWGVILRFVGLWSATKALDELYNKVTHYVTGGNMVNIADFGGTSYSYGRPAGGGSTSWEPGVGPVFHKKRRRRARLTQGELMELNQIKNILGKTAAANALPFYLGRGR